MAKNILNKCRKITVATIKNKEFCFYFPPKDLCAQYTDETLEWLHNRYNETQDKEFIIWFYMYKVASMVFGENLAYGLVKGRRFKTDNFNKLFFNAYKSNLPHPLPPIKFEISNFDIPMERKLSNRLEETFKAVIKNELTDNSLYFDSSYYIDFKTNFLNGLINLTWDKKITNEKVRQWAEQEFRKTNSDYKTLLHYDCEKYYLSINDIVHHKIYKAIRKFIPKEEKRLFILNWFMQYKSLGKKLPYYPFGIRIPSFYRIFLDFYLGMPNPIKEDLLSWILSKKSSKTKLNELWDKYLKIYPVWLLITREEDRIDKQTSRALRNERSLQEVIARSKNGEEQTLEEIAGQENYALLRNLTEIDILDTPSFTDKEKELTKLILTGYSISCIAQEKKISQPAISKMLKNIREKLKNHLI